MRSGGSLRRRAAEKSRGSSHEGQTGGPGRPLKGSRGGSGQRQVRSGAESAGRRRAEDLKSNFALFMITRKTSQDGPVAEGWGEQAQCVISSSPRYLRSQTHAPSPPLGNFPSTPAGSCWLNPSASSKVEPNTFALCPAWHKKNSLPLPSNREIGFG